MKVKQFAAEIAKEVIDANTPEQAGEVIGKILKAAGTDPRAVGVTLAYIEDVVPFGDALGLWKLVGELVPGVDRHNGSVLKNDLWFEGIEWDMSTPVPNV